MVLVSHYTPNPFSMDFVIVCFKTIELLYSNNNNGVLSTLKCLVSMADFILASIKPEKSGKAEGDTQTVYTRL